MAEVKKVDKTAESTGIQNVGSGEAYPKPVAGEVQPKTLAEARAKHDADYAAQKEAQDKVLAEVAERDANAKPGEAKPSKRAEREMAVGKAAVGGGASAKEKTA